MSSFSHCSLMLSTQSIFIGRGGTEKKIEVKTTTRNVDTPFPIKLNEIMFSEVHSVNYSLYHVYNLNRLNKVAEFHEYAGNLKDHFLFESMRFNAFRKSKAANR